jgi:hypothetical protein
MVPGFLKGTGTLDTLTALLKAVLSIRIRNSSESRRAKITQKNKKQLINFIFEVLDVLF